MHIGTCCTAQMGYREIDSGMLLEDAKCASIQDKHMAIDPCVARGLTEVALQVGRRFSRLNQFGAESNNGFWCGHCDVVWVVLLLTKWAMSDGLNVEKDSVDLSSIATTSVAIGYQ